MFGQPFIVQPNIEQPDPQPNLLKQEEIEWEKNPPEGVLAFNPKYHNPLQWKLLIKGPYGSLYQDGIYQVRLQFSLNYPQSPPEMYLDTPIYHPNIEQTGIWSRAPLCLSCLGITEDSPICAKDFVQLFYDLLKNPKQFSHNKEALELMQMDRKLFEQEVRKHLENHAQGKQLQSYSTLMGVKIFESEGAQKYFKKFEDPHIILKEINEFYEHLE